MNKIHFNSKYHDILTKNFLIQEYVTLKKSTRQIAKEIGCSPTIVGRYLIKYKIKSKGKYVELSCKICKRIFIGHFNQKYCKKCNNNGKTSYKLYVKTHKEQLKKYKKEYNRKYKTKPVNKLINRVRVRTLRALKGIYKAKPTIKLLGCSVLFLKSYLEHQFTKDMNWNNYGIFGWHIDHIKPCFSFDLSKESEQKKCFHYTNLQPLWAKDNLSKGKKEKIK